MNVLFVVMYAPSMMDEQVAAINAVSLYEDATFWMVVVKTPDEVTSDNVDS